MLFIALCFPKQVRIEGLVLNWQVLIDAHRKTWFFEFAKRKHIAYCLREIWWEMLDDAEECTIRRRLGIEQQLKVLIFQARTLGVKI